MNRMVLGALAALLMVSAGLFWWQGRAELAQAVPPPDISAGPPAGQSPIVLPTANPNARGSRLPQASKTKVSKAQQRFNRYDRNRDGQITRNEMLSTRVKAFQKLDTNHDNMLSFEEWAVKTADRFKEIDSNHDGVITAAELASYDAGAEAKKKHRKLPARCADGARGTPSIRPSPTPDGTDSDGDPGDPAQ